MSSIRGIAGRVALATVGRVYATFYEFASFATQLRFSLETTAAVPTVTLLYVNFASGYALLALPARFPVSDASWSMFAIAAVGGWFVQIVAARRLFVPAIERLARETPNQRFWRGVGVLSYIALSIVFGAAAVRRCSVTEGQRVAAPRGLAPDGLRPPLKP